MPNYTVEETKSSPSQPIPDAPNMETVLADLWVARMTLAYIRDKAESSSVTRLHLKEVAKAGILKSGGPITLMEAARDVLVAETKVPTV